MAIDIVAILHIASQIDDAYKLAALIILAVFILVLFVLIMRMRA